MCTCAMQERDCCLVMDWTWIRVTEADRQNTWCATDPLGWEQNPCTLQCEFALTKSMAADIVQAAKIRHPLSFGGCKFLTIGASAIDRSSAKAYCGRQVHLGIQTFPILVSATFVVVNRVASHEMGRRDAFITKMGRTTTSRPVPPSGEHHVQRCHPSCSSLYNKQSTIG